MLPILVSACFGDKRHSVSDEEPAVEEPASPQRPAVPAEAVRDRSSHLLLTLELREGGVRLVATQRVALALPTRRKEVAGAIRLELLAADGQVLYHSFVDDPRPLRGEFAHGETMQAVHFERKTAALVVRLPLHDDARQIRLVNVEGGQELGRLEYPGVAR